MKRIVGGAVERLQRLCLICQVDDDGCVRIHAGLLFLASIFPIYTCGSKRHEQTEEGIRITRNPRTAHREKERERDGYCGYADGKTSNKSYAFAIRLTLWVIRLRGKISLLILKQYNIYMYLLSIDDQFVHDIDW